MEKIRNFEEHVPQYRGVEGGVANKTRKYIFITLLSLGSIAFAYHLDLWGFARHGGCATHSNSRRPHPVEPLCPQVPPISPTYNTEKLESVLERLRSNEYFGHSAKLLSESVQINTEISDNVGPVGEDKAWDRMGDFTAWLKTAFPLIHENLNLEYVNTYAPVYTWEGSDPELKPVVLYGHFDTVLVDPETLDQWTYPPFSGHIDDNGLVWGRGASDDKSQVVATLEAVELLLEADFKPKRTVILAYGFDEEIGGPNGARLIGEMLHKKYGDDGIALYHDEGSDETSLFGADFLLVGIAEKGHIDMEVTISVKGGHSSMPPPHTAIGILAEFVTEIERNQYPIALVDGNPFYDFLTCAAEHGPRFPDYLRKYIDEGDKEGLAEEIVKLDPLSRFMMTTTIAVTIIQGGLKINSLPELVKVFGNHRINYGSTTEDVIAMYKSIASSIAEKHSLEVIPFPDNATYPVGSITLQIIAPLEPSPVSPTRVDISTPFKLIAGTTRQVFGEDKIVSPVMMPANTDSKFFWKLTKHIFRYKPATGFPSSERKIHGVDEKDSVAAHVSMVEWFFTFLRNVDETEFE
ncbi:Aminoacylase-1 [Dactylella cylindrospora]|nr:Aminoacylase-1 [Dactylella cylindrospora]